MTTMIHGEPTSEQKPVPASRRRDLSLGEPMLDMKSKEGLRHRVLLCDALKSLHGEPTRYERPIASQRRRALCSEPYADKKPTVVLSRCTT